MNRNRIRKYTCFILLFLFLTSYLPQYTTFAEDKTYNSVTLSKEEKAKGTMKAYELIQKYLDPDYVKLYYHDSIAYSDGYDHVGYSDVSESDYLELKKISENITKNCKSDYEKITELARAIAKRVYYDNEYLHGSRGYTSWQPLEIWNEKRTTCIGYSMLYLIMADSLGIPCMRMHTGGHVYNLAYSYSEKRWIIVDTMQAAIPKEVTVEGKWIDSDKIIESWIDAEPKRLCQAAQSIEYVEGLLVGNMYYRLDTGWGLNKSKEKEWGLKSVDEWVLYPIAKKDQSKKTKTKTTIDGIKVEKASASIKQPGLAFKEIRKAIKKMKFKETDSVYYKVKKVHDWISLNFEYDTLFGNWYAGNYSDYTEKMIAEAKTHTPWLLDWAFEHKLANCSAYSNIFKIFMDELGIECKYISSNKMNHAWNMVKMDDGHWYHIDVTWDDSKQSDTDNGLGGYSTKYFLRNDENFPYHYDWDPDAPKADGDYYEKNTNHDISYTRTAKDKYWKNGNIKISYGNRSGCKDCVTRFYENGNVKSEKYTYISSGSKVIKNYDKKGNLTRASYENADGSAYIDEYDSNGNYTLYESKSADGSIVIRKGCITTEGNATDAEYIHYINNGTLLYYYKGNLEGFKWNGKGYAEYYMGENNAFSFDYEGEFKDYIRDGKGILRTYYPSGKIKYSSDGLYSQNKFIKGTITNYDEYGNVISSYWFEN